MERQEVTVIFDIGKTNKKLFIFDEELKEICNYHERFDEIKDDDGYLGENLIALSEWMKSSVRQIIEEGKYVVKNINISAYGASIVHLDKNGNLAAPFYNYTKPLPNDFYNRFFKSVENSNQFSIETASPLLGMLNSGIQLFYIKHYKPELVKNIKYSLHLPQYLSYLFTGRMVSDFTSIGCHTGLWDFRTMEYHSWVKKAGFESQLAPLVQTNQSYPVNLYGQQVNVGVGIHDSSSALIPYLANKSEPFNLLSTGTWSVSINPFNKIPLTKEEFEKDCLNYISYTGEPVKASRLFLGKELRHQAKIIADHFNCSYDRYKSVLFDSQFVDKRKNKEQLLFKYDYLKPHLFGFKSSDHGNLKVFQSFEDAYRQLLDELTDLQVKSLELTIAGSGVECIHIDGGFTSNEPFIQNITNKLPGLKIYTRSSAPGSALGAAILVNGQMNNENHDGSFFNNYNRIQHHPVLTN